MVSIYFKIRCVRTGHQRFRQVNVAAIFTDKSVPFGESIPLGGKWLIDATSEEVAAPFSVKYGPESNIFKVMQHLSRPNKLPIHLVYPVLKSYSKGRVALAGDAVSFSVTRKIALTYLFLSRPML